MIGNPQKKLRRKATMGTPKRRAAMDPTASRVETCRSVAVAMTGTERLQPNPIRACGCPFHLRLDRNEAKGAAFATTQPHNAGFTFLSILRSTTRWPRQTMRPSAPRPEPWLCRLTPKCSQAPILLVAGRRKAPTLRPPQPPLRR